MRRAVTWLVALLAAALFIGTPTAVADEGQPQPPLASVLRGDVPTDPLTVTLRVEALVNQFAAENGLPTVGFVNLEPGQAGQTPCGWASSEWAYFVCGGYGADTPAYIGIEQQKWFRDGTHYMAPWFLIAHEAGHVWQNYQYNPVYGENIEDGGDCVGGAWLHWVNDHEQLGLTLSDALGMYNLMIKIEKQGFNDMHGTRTARSIATVIGFTGGIKACNVYAPVAL